MTLGWHINFFCRQIDAALSFASTSETTPEDINEAKLRTKLKEQHEKANCAEYSLDDHIVDYELRRVKERRAHEEVLSGRYRHPAFIARSSQGLLLFYVHSIVASQKNLVHFYHKNSGQSKKNFFSFFQLKNLKSKDYDLI